MSLSQLTNQNCTVLLTNSAITVHDSDDRLIMHGTKAPTDALWPLTAVSQPAPAPHCANLSVRNRLDAEKVNWAVATLGSPSASTLLAALDRGYLDGFPQLTASMVRNNWPNSTATAFGHLHANRSGQRSTRTTAASDSLAGSDDTDIDAGTSLFCKVVPIIEIGAHADLAGRFPHTALSGNQYVLVCLFRGYIHLELMKDRSSPNYVAAFSKAMAFFAEHCSASPPLWWRIDNESSNAVDRLFRNAGVQLQKVPAGDHRANKAERAIQAAKEHIISTLCTAHKDFLVQLAMGRVRSAGRAHTQLAATLATRSCPQCVARTAWQ